MLRYYYNIDDLNSYDKNSNIFIDKNKVIYILEPIYNKKEIYHIHELNFIKYLEILIMI